ncbi:MAG TPA: phosphoenolpyruvate--protein phosphotransferase [Acidobacteriota bacterium]|nr:phosphoenolpyruvate--protein phosphotransferase [Acidobacteriota bacterium]HNT18336.1 phosphoenolpyruvate--protein phosphotransferase [Acidobacteriota bacterium]
MRFKGTPVSQGITIGHAHPLDVEDALVPSYEIEESAVDAEVSKFNTALNRTIDELSAVKDAAAENAESDEMTAIFDVHIAMLKDPGIKRNTISKIITERKNAESAFSASIKSVLDILENSPDHYFRERVVDIRDLAQKVQSHMMGLEQAASASPFRDPILVASQLSPSQTGPFQDLAKGFVTEHGARTSHTAILARSLRIPAVVGIPGLMHSISPGDEIIVDGLEGEVIVKPSEEEKAHYIEKMKAFREYHEKLVQEAKKVSRTVDGHHIRLKVNIDFEEELKNCAEFGAEGVGLYRSEFLYLQCAPNLPSEEEHAAYYTRIAEAVYPHRATIRTLDLGGEKYFQEILEPKAVNPVLGLRAIRFSLRHWEMFQTQLRGILRASYKKNVSVMFPMVSMLEELQMARAALSEAMDSLRRDSVPFDPDIQVGIMVEIPVCALNAEAFAPYCDFFSIGSNDLIQYLMAIDRNNESMADYYDPHHPAFLRLLGSVAEAAKSRKIPVSICGEVASDPNLIPLFIGLGIEEFSMTPEALLEVKAKVRSLSFKECHKLAAQAVKAWTGTEVKNLLMGRPIKEKKFLGLKWSKGKSDG